MRNYLILKGFSKFSCLFLSPFCLTACLYSKYLFFLDREFLKIHKSVDLIEAECSSPMCFPGNSLNDKNSFCEVTVFIGIVYNSSLFFKFCFSHLLFENSYHFECKDNDQLDWCLITYFFGADSKIISK